MAYCNSDQFTKLTFLRHTRNERYKNKVRLVNQNYVNFALCRFLRLKAVVE